MQKRFLFVLLSLAVLSFESISQSTDVYLLTCSPGDETYSMYGHSALRLVDSTAGTDLVYNWGVFDFSTPNFNYKFARGRLDYMLGVYSYNRFLREYFSEERSVYSQKVNLDEKDIVALKEFLQNNLRDENRYYRYDFFMDNCATRIRDIFENILGDQLLYPDYPGDDLPSYRDRLKEYQAGMLWLDAGVDILLGTPADQACDFRGSMFLPDYLMANLSTAMVSKDGDPYKLLENPVTVFEFERDEADTSLMKQPWFWLGLAALLVFLFTFLVNNKILQGTFDQILFIVLFGLSFLMIFTNYLTDHNAMTSNFNMVWLNPLLLFSPFVIFIKKRFNWLWSLNIALSVVFMIMALFISQAVNPAFIPIILIIILRSYYRLEYYKHV